MTSQSTTPSTIRIVLAEDQAMVRSAIRALVDTVRGAEVVGEARDGRELIELVDRLEPDLVMTDVSMPGMDGITAIAEIKARHPGMHVLMLSMHNSADVVRRAVACGASGYVMKDAPAFELEHAVHTMMRNGTYFSPSITALLLQPAERSAEQELTPRQVEIVKLMVRGRSAAEVASELGLSPKTVAVHRTRIMERLGLRDVASLTLYAVRKGLVKP